MVKVVHQEIINCNVKKVWKLVTSMESKWRSDLEDIQVVDEVTFIEIDKSGISTMFYITKKIENKLYEFNLENKNIKGHWTGEFREIDTNHVELTFTEEIEVKSKIMKLFAKIFLKKQQKLYFKDLINALF